MKTTNVEKATLMYNRSKSLAKAKPAIVSQHSNPNEWAECLASVASKQDSNAYARLYEHFAPRLNSYFLRLGCDSGTAEEMVQEAFLIVWRRAEAFNPAKAKVSTWLFTLARNRFIDLKCRKAGPEALLSADDLFPIMPDDSDPIDESVDLLRRGGQIRLSLKDIPEAQAEVVHKSYFEDKTHQEIADELGIPVGTVKSRLRLALQRLSHIFVGGQA